MKKTIKLLLAISFCTLPASFCMLPATTLAQGLDPSLLTKPATDAWPSYGGDYTQRRFSSLKQIDKSNVKDLTLAWVGTLEAGEGKGGGFFAPAGPPTIVGGIAAKAVPVMYFGAGPRVGGGILEVNGILYMAAPDNAWAMDARDGTVLWHYYWKTRGGTHIGNRGMAMYHDWLYFETPDDVLVSLDAKTGKERWHKEISDFNEQYFSTTAPMVVGDHLLVGTSDDIDSPGFLQAFDPDTGDLQWKHYTVPMAKGDPGLDTWASLDAARHGGAQVWMPGSYDPETHLYIFPTGNPTPAYVDVTRGPGANLFTSSIVAVNVDTGKMAWYYQTSPHDMHDWDSTQEPVLVDGTFEGKPRKMVMQAARNGFFFVLDRTTGEHLLTTKYSEAANWSSGLDKNGGPIHNPEKDATLPGSLVSPDNGGATNWPPPSFDPETGLFYVQLREVYAMYYQTDTDLRLVTGLGGVEEDTVGSLGSFIAAIDYKTGKLAWKYRFPGESSGQITGLLTTAGKLLFSSDLSGNLAAYDVANGTPLWHAHIGAVANAAETYMLDGRQYILISTGETIYAFSLPQGK